MKAIIDYYPLDSKANITVFNKNIRVSVRAYDKSKGENKCEQCCFREQILDTAFSGQRRFSGYCCGLTVRGNVNCSPMEREDKQDIVYKKVVKK